MFEGVFFAISLLGASESSSELSDRTHAGIFISLFETSLFEPCNSDERWWLEARDGLSEPFWNKVQELRAERERQTGEPLKFASPPMYLTAKGDVSMLGDYGHLGQYDRLFNVKTLSEFRLATNEERIQCVTSGFFSDAPAESE